MPVAPDLLLAPWGREDIALLRRLNAPEMKVYLGGPESEEKLLDRQRRYEATPLEEGRILKVVDAATQTECGSVLYWRTTHRASNAPVWEIGWAIVPECQGRGIATQAVHQALAMARADGVSGALHAFPNVDNAPSNALCARLGFQLVDTVDLEYPKGNPIRCNDWRLDLTQ